MSLPVVIGASVLGGMLVAGLGMYVIMKPGAPATVPAYVPAPMPQVQQVQREKKLRPDQIRVLDEAYRDIVGVEDTTSRRWNPVLGRMCETADSVFSNRLQRCVR